MTARPLPHPPFGHLPPVNGRREQALLTGSARAYSTQFPLPHAGKVSEGREKAARQAHHRHPAIRRPQTSSYLAAQQAFPRRAG
ncbi:hypothetical protein XFF6166_40002 [Xanthomonas citri pv. fuscans]|uniref:Uncharacterized protein n=1 Tax=Xanthomonas campestris pv. phaseoli TaxID=317013 RepID=A0A7Z7IZA0_XANCH|nr:hypothetical protein XFF6166_40002 [Xanthomonas citri pv. fuscans]SOO22958.1 hypothetical protein XFF6991_180066 [Xanthomonas phaseoli pv. phaseoli]SON96956.1 hypothetical protein XFF6990_40001 [Xanthomonas citri pv. fuscans]SOO01903.1 hypothetical protein XFF6960_530022 [Xanthomonas citri pv. fuscans]SOO05083.1 hypothetical protein XFF7767_360002 [Xanthomonas citri pv. fuscans]